MNFSVSLLLELQNRPGAFSNILYRLGGASAEA